MTEYRHRAASIFAGFFTLIQSLIWVILAILFIAAYTCNIEIPLKEPINSQSILYLTYFKGPCYPGQESPVATRTYIWMTVYAVVSACWIPASVLLLVAAILKVRGNYGACLFTPWLIITIIVLVVDLAATIIYAIDISMTLTVTDYEHFIYPLKYNLKGADGITVLPAIELTLFFCRVVVVWLINFVLVIVMIQAVHSIRKSRYSGNYTKNIQKERPELTSSELQDSDHRECGGKRWVEVFHPEPSTPTRQFEQDKPPDGMLRPQPQVASQEPRHPWVLVNNQRREPEARSQQPWVERREQAEIYPQPLREDTAQARIEPWVRQASQQQEQIDIENASSLSRGSPGQPRIFSVDGTPVAEQATPLYQRRPPRGGDSSQMPWTYLGGPKSGIKPKPKTPEKPSIPVPDYTMHAPNTRKYPAITQQRSNPGVSTTLGSKEVFASKHQLNSGGY